MQETKSIWIINQTAGTFDSGWGERHLSLSQYWIKKGYKVKIFSGSYNHLFTNQPTISKKWFTIQKINESIEFCWVKTPKYHDGGFRKFWSNMIFTFRLFFFSTSKVQKPSIILVSSMPIFSIVNGIYFKNKLKSKKLIVEIRDLWPLTPIYLKGYSPKHPLVKIVGWFEKLAYRKSDKIVSLLPNAREYIDAISKDESKFIYIPNGVEDGLLKNEKLPKSLKEMIPKNKFIIGYAGTLGLANAMEYFIEASTLMQEYEDVHFVLVGDGYLKDQFLTQVINQRNCTFLPKVKKSQVQNVLKTFDVCYVGRYNSPLYKHGVSYNKYFDYMLANKVILESSELIKDPVELSGCGLIVNSESAEAVKEGILQLKQMSIADRSAMAQKGYNYVKKYHSYQYLANLYLQLFD